MITIEKDSAMVKLAAVIGIAVYVAQILEMNRAASMGFVISIVCVCVSFCMHAVQKNRIKVSDLAVLAIVFLAIVAAGLQRNFDYYKPAIIVICTVFCIDLCTEYQVGENTKNHILSLFVYAALFTNAVYYWGGLNKQYYLSTNALALNFSNPNETAMWLFSIVVILFGGMDIQKKRRKKAILLLSGASLIPILYATQARSCLIALIFWLGMKLCLKIFKLKAVPGWIILLVTLAPIIVYAGYMYVFIPNYDRMSEWFSFAVSDGKSLTSRYKLWGLISEDFWKCALIGKYDVYFDEQLHNSLGTLFCRFGMAFVVLLCRKFYSVVKCAGVKEKQMSLLAMWLVGCFELGYFAGVSGLYLWILLFPLFEKHSE